MHVSAWVQVIPNTCLPFSQVSPSIQLPIHPPTPIPTPISIHSPRPIQVQIQIQTDTSTNTNTDRYKYKYQYKYQHKSAHQHRYRYKSTTKTKWMDVKRQNCIYDYDALSPKALRLQSKAKRITMMQSEPCSIFAAFALQSSSAPICKADCIAFLECTLAENWEDKNAS